MIPIHIKRARERAEAFNAKIDAQREVAAGKVARARANELEKQLDTTRRFMSDGISQQVIESTNRQIAEAIAEKFVENVKPYFVEDHEGDIYDIVLAALNLSGLYVPDADVRSITAALAEHGVVLSNKFERILDIIDELKRLTGGAGRISRYGATISKTMKHYSTVNARLDYGSAIPEIMFTTRVYWDRPLEYACSVNVPMYAGRTKGT